MLCLGLPGTYDTEENLSLRLLTLRRNKIVQGFVTSKNRENAKDSDRNIDDGGECYCNAIEIFTYFM